MKDPDFKYFAFISYSHRDSRWGDWLHRKLETFRVPPHLSEGEKDLPARIFPVFRDREELPTSSGLNEQIRGALEQSRYLLVICSPRAATSRWVNEEILIFKSLGRSDRILTLIVDGEPNATEKPGIDEEECFPEALRFEINEDGSLSDRHAEPIAADARPGKDGKADALLKIAAGLLQVGFDDLKQRELRRKHRRMLVLTSVALGLTILTSALAVAAVVARKEAEAQKEKAVQTLSRSQFLQGAGLIEKDRAMDGMAHLARSIRVDPSNRFAVDAILANLVYRTWPMPLGEPRVWAESEVVRVDLSRDAGLMAISTAEGPVRTYARESGELLAEIDEGEEPFRVLLHPTMDLLALTTNLGDFRIYNVRSGEALTKWFGMEEKTADYHRAFSPDGKYFAAAGGPAGFFVWPIREDPGTPTHLDHALDTVVFSSDGDYILSADTNLVQVWEFGEGELLERTSEEINISAPVQYAVLLDDDIVEAVIANWRREVAVWDLEEGEMFGDPLVFEKRIGDLVLEEDGEAVLIAAGKEVRLLDALSVRPLSESAIHLDRVLLNRFIEGSRRALTVYHDDAQRLMAQEWDFRPGKLTPDRLDLGVRIEEAAFGRGSERFLIRTDERVVMAYEIEPDDDVNMVRGFGGGDFKVQFAVMAPSGENFLTVGQGNFLELHKVKGETTDSQKFTPGGVISTAAFTDDGASVFLGYIDGRGEVWDSGSGVVEDGTFSLGAAPLHAAYDREGKVLAVCTSDRQVQLWDVNGEMPRLIGRRTFESQVNGLAYDRRGRVLACAAGSIGEAGAVHFLDTRSGERVAASIDTLDGVHAVSFDARGERVAAAAYDGSVRVWDVESGVALTPPLRDGEPALALRFEEGDGRLLTLSTGGKLRRWRIPTIGEGEAPEWLAGLAEAVARRALDERGVLETIAGERFAETREDLIASDSGDDLLGLARWILEDRVERSPQPEN